MGTINTKPKAVIYSCLPLTEGIYATLFKIAVEKDINIVANIIESLELYRVTNKQPNLHKVMDAIQQNDVKHILVPSLSHLFTVDAYKVMVDLATLNALKVEIHTPDGDISMDSPIHKIFHYANHRNAVVRKIAAEAARVRGTVLGRPKITADFDELKRLVNTTGSVNKAARMMGISHHTATRILQSGGSEANATASSTSGSGAKV